MKRLLLFGGAVEGRELLRQLAARPVAVSVSVATDYGRETLGEADLCGAELLTGRLGADDIAKLLQNGGYGCVVDATHPYAVEATANIARAAETAGVPCLRLERQESPLTGCITVRNASEAAAELAKTNDNVLLTTGAKELALFTAVPDFARRLYVRVLPSRESIAACLANGYRQSHILAMQGPFSRELNIAVMREWQIGTVVSKDGGRAGGFDEKRQAAETLGATLIVIRRPDSAGGTSLARLLEEIDRWLQAS